MATGKQKISDKPSRSDKVNSLVFAMNTSTINEKLQTLKHNFLFIKDEPTKGEVSFTSGTETLLINSQPTNN